MFKRALSSAALPALRRRRRRTQRPSAVTFMWQPKAGGALFLCAVLCVAAAAQGGGGQRRKGAGAKMRDGRPRAELTLEQQYALNVLDQLLSSSKESGDDRLRIRTQSQVADILWPYDEPRARGLFKEAFEAIVSIRRRPIRLRYPARPRPRSACKARCSVSPRPVTPTWPKV